ARMIQEGVLTEKDFKLCQTIWDMFDEIHPLVKEAMRKSDGFNMGYIQGWTVKTPFGDFRGGYVPVASKEGLKVDKIESLLNPETDGFRAMDMYPSMNVGMTNERTQTYYPVSLDMGRISAYLSAAMNIAYLRN